ncbi:hypothetical protein V6Z11_D08G112200 [Gossypium hirsutum]
MAIISEVKDEGAKPSASSSPEPKPTSFVASFNPSNVVGFLEKVFDFIAKESDFLGKESVDKEIALIARVATDKYYKKKAEEMEKKKKKEEEITKKAEKEPTEAGGKDKQTNPNLREFQGTERTRQQQLLNLRRDFENLKMKEEETLLSDPTKGNGLDLENYSWTQTIQEATVIVPVPPGTRSKSVECQMKKSHLKVGLRGQPPIIDGELFQAIKPDDCYWSMEDNDSISIVLSKQSQLEWWKSLVKGEPEIDTQKVEPESSRISDLDPETRLTVEKLMFDQRQKALGLPASDEIQKQAMLKQFMAMNPTMDLSNAKMM